MAIEIICLNKARELRYKASKNLHVVAGLILNLKFHEEDPDGVGDKVDFFLFPDLSLSAIYEAELVVRKWDVDFYSSMKTTHTYTA